MDHLPADRQEDMAAELRRLRRENEVLRQEREILKRATAFFAKEGSRWLVFRRCGDGSTSAGSVIWKRRLLSGRRIWRPS